MLGNRAGWMLAVVVLVAESIGVYYALSLDAYAKPTATASSQALAAIQLPPVPSFLFSETGSADAGALYRAAATEYLARSGEIETMIRDSDRASLASLPALDKILAAKTARSGPIFAGQLDQIIDYGEPNALQAVARLGHAAYRTGALQGRRAQDRARAMEYYEAAFALGRRLADERLTWREYDAGISLMSSSGAAMVVELRKLPDRVPDAEALQAYLDAQLAQYKQFLLTFEAIYTNNETKIATHAGDVFVFATDAQEPMWRVEAILKLGRMRYNVGNPRLAGNQRHAVRLLKQLKDSPDAKISRAANVALDLTVERFRTLR